MINTVHDVLDYIYNIEKQGKQCATIPLTEQEMEAISLDWYDIEMKSHFQNATDGFPYYTNPVPTKLEIKEGGSLYGIPVKKSS